MRLMMVLACAALAAPAWSAELKVGGALVPITPKVGTPMAGYFYERPSEGVHDDLFARTIVLDVDGQAAALVVLDLVSAPRELVAAARREIERATPIHGDHVMISATHSHTGPIVNSDSPFGGGSALVARFLDEAPKQIAQSVKQAYERRAPVKAFVAHGHETSIAFNRRYHMKDGTVGWNPGKLNPRVLKPAGTIDPDLPFVYFEAARDRKPVATYVNYAVHLDNIGSTQFSADLPYTLSRMLAEYKGPEMTTVYATGCCGDINHINVNWREPQRGFTNPARMGIILAAAVLRAWPDLKAVEAPALRVKREIVHLDLPSISAADLEKARAMRDRIMKKAEPKPSFREQVEGFKVLAVEARKGKPQEVEVQVIALGDQLAWVSLPGEIFTELGLEIKQDSPFPTTFIAELANGAIGYIPARRAYPQGAYEVLTTRCAQGSGERLVDAAVRLLKELHIEATSTTTKAK